MSKKKIKEWSWNSLRKKYSFRYESDYDQSLSIYLQKTILKAREYSALSFRDFWESLVINKKLLWMSTLIMSSLGLLVYYNAEKIISFNIKSYTPPFMIQVVLVVILVVFLFNLPKIIRHVWLELGPNMRWFRVFLVLELIVIITGIYCLMLKQFSNIANSISQTTSVIAIAIAIIGVLRQRHFERLQKLASSSSRLFKERTILNHFVINGQIGPIKRLQNTLKTENDPSSPLTILMDGKWGDGKTYVVNHVIDSLSANENNYVIVKFEPWRHVSEEAIITNFYNALGLALSNLPGSAGIQIDMAALSRSFVSKMDKTGTVESLLTQIPRKTSSTTSLEKAEKLLNDTRKRLLFVIDDVERCRDKERILRTLQLGLHLGSDIKNSTTVIIGDVQEIIKSTGVHESFLQKIVDEQIVVLPPTKKEMLSIINALMQNLNISIKLTQDQRLDFLMRNIRGIKRVLNGLNQDYEAIQSNIHPQDLFTMNVLKHSLPTVYADITHNSALYVPYTYTDYSDEEFSLYGFGGEKEDSEFIKDQIEHFQELLKTLKLSDRNRRRLISVLENLFPATKYRFNGDSQANNTSVRKDRRDRRIGVNREYLDRYFLLSNDVDKRHVIEDSQELIKEKYFSETNDELRLNNLRDTFSHTDDDSEELFYSGLTDILADLDHNDSNRKILARDMIRLYFLNTKNVIKDEKRGLLIILDAIDRYVNNDSYTYIFENLEEYMQHPSTGLRLLLYMNPTRNNSFHNLKRHSGYKDLRTKILSKVDQYYITDTHDIINEDTTNDQEWRFSIAQWSTSVCYDDHNDFIKSRFNKVNDYLMLITDDSPKKFHDLLMGAFWHSNMMDKKSEFNFKITPPPYDAKKFATRARRLINDENVDHAIKQDLNLYLKSYNEFRRAEKSNT